MDSMTKIFGLGCLTPLSTIFQLYVAVSFIGGGNRGTRIKPPTDLPQAKIFGLDKIQQSLILHNLSTCDVIATYWCLLYESVWLIFYHYVPSSIILINYIQNNLYHWFFNNLLLGSFNPGLFWIGGSDTSNETNWMWYPSKNEFEYTNWFSANPDYSSHKRHCTLVDVHNGYKWRNDICEETRNYICEAPPRKPGPVVGK